MLFKDNPTRDNVITNLLQRILSAFQGCIHFSSQFDQLISKRARHLDRSGPNSSAQPAAYDRLSEANNIFLSRLSLTWRVAFTISAVVVC